VCSLLFFFLFPLLLDFHPSLEKKFKSALKVVLKILSIFSLLQFCLFRIIYEVIIFFNFIFNRYSHKSDLIHIFYYNLFYFRWFLQWFLYIYIYIISSFLSFFPMKSNPFLLLLFFSLQDFLKIDYFILQYLISQVFGFLVEFKF
jgi:hypothetical protein